MLQASRDYHFSLEIGVYFLNQMVLADEFVLYIGSVILSSSMINSTTRKNLNKFACYGWLV